MRKSTFKYIEAQLYLHQENKKMIKEIEYNIMFTKPNTDENIGGGKSNLIVSKVENSVIKLDSNKKLYTIRKIVSTVDDVYEHMSEPYQKLIELKYFKRNQYTWRGICEELHVSRATAFRMRRKIIDEIADRLGLI